MTTASKTTKSRGKNIKSKAGSRSKEEPSAVRLSGHPALRGLLCGISLPLLLFFLILLSGDQLESFAALWGLFLFAAMIAAWFFYFWRRRKNEKP